jgi:hypothetical protein
MACAGAPLGPLFAHVSNREIGSPQHGRRQPRRSIAMLIAPFSVSPAERPRAPFRPIARVARTKPRIGGLLAWLAVGIGAVLLVPFARGDRFFGATLPFWLVVAPLVDLGWVERRRLMRHAAEGWRGFVRARPARNVRAQRAPRRAACSAARS